MLVLILMPMQIENNCGLFLSAASNFISPYFGQYVQQNIMQLAHLMLCVVDICAATAVTNNTGVPSNAFEFKKNDSSFLWGSFQMCWFDDVKT